MVLTVEESLILDLQFVVIVKCWQTGTHSGSEYNCCSSSCCSFDEKREVCFEFLDCARHRGRERESENDVVTAGVASFLLGPCEHSILVDSGSSCSG